MLSMNDYGKFEKRGDDYTVLGSGNGVFSETIAHGDIEFLTQKYLNGEFKLNSSFNAILHEVYGDYSYFPEELLEDKQIAIAAVTEEATTLYELPESTMNDHDVIVAAIQSDNTLSFGLPKELFDDKDFSLKLIESCHPSNITYFLDKLSDRLKDDKEVILAAVSIRGDALALASDRLKNDIMVVKTAIDNDPVGPRKMSPGVIGFASELIQNNPSILDVDFVFSDGITYAHNEKTNEYGILADGKGLNIIAYGTIEKLVSEHGIDIIPEALKQEKSVSQSIKKMTEGKAASFDSVVKAAKEKAAAKSKETDHKPNNKNR